MNNNLLEQSTTVRSTAIFSKDKKRRYTLRYEWDKNLPKACIIMSQPSN